MNEREVDETFDVDDEYDDYGCGDPWCHICGDPEDPSRFEDEDDSDE